MANSPHDPGNGPGRRGGKRGGKRDVARNVAGDGEPATPAMPETGESALAGRDDLPADAEAPGRPDPEFREDDLSDDMTDRTAVPGDTLDGTPDDTLGGAGAPGVAPYGSAAEQDSIAGGPVPALDDDPIGPGGPGGRPGRTGWGRTAMMAMTRPGAAAWPRRR